MKEKSQLNLPADLLFTRDHLWVSQQGDVWVAGISDYGQDQLGGVVFVELPAAGTSWKAGEEFGGVESVKAVNGLFMPVDGEIVEVNAALEEEPGVINSSCYDSGWLVKFRPADPASVKALMNADAYRESLG